jgi:hypothetical protein
MLVSWGRSLIAGLAYERRGKTGGQFLPEPPQTPQLWNPLPLQSGHCIWPFSPVPLQREQGVFEVPEPWQVWQTAAAAMPAVKSVAKAVKNHWRRVMFLSSFIGL